MSILVFDSGIGGLTVLREARIAMPERHFIYVGDDAGFPYGDWDEPSLVTRIVSLFDALLGSLSIELAIVACNTASTLIMPALRERFAIPFVGTVPAIKPACERTRSGLVSVLATPGTVDRPYTRQLVEDFGAGADVALLGSRHLARMAERWLHQRELDTGALRREIAPCFIERDGRRTDIVVLGCTHYPFLVNEMRKLAPWPVDWIEPAEAIAQRAATLLPGHGVSTSGLPGESLLRESLPRDNVIMTASQPGAATPRLLNGFGLVPLPSPALADLDRRTPA